MITRALSARGLAFALLTASLSCARPAAPSPEPAIPSVETALASAPAAQPLPLGDSFRTTSPGKHPSFFLEGDGWVPYALGAGLLLASDSALQPFLQRTLGGNTTRSLSHSASFLGTPTVYLGTPLALYALGGSRGRGAATKMANALVTSGMLTQMVKMAAGRRRPNQSNGAGGFEGPGSGFESFPSGHTSAAFAMATVLGSEYPRYKVPIFALATAVAASRVLQDKHFPSDVFVGAGIGLLAGNQAVRGGPNMLGFRF